MPIPRTADPDVTAIVAAVLKQHHHDLHVAGVEIACLMVFPDLNEATGEPKGPPLKLHGWPCAAIVKINSLSDRVEGKADATIKIDGVWWKDATDAQKNALIDEQLEFLEVRLEDEGNSASIMTDDANRPKLRLRKADFRAEGFESILERHGRNAPEAVPVGDMLKRPVVQRLFQWG